MLEKWMFYRKAVARHDYFVPWKMSFSEYSFAVQWMWYSLLERILLFTLWKARLIVFLCKELVHEIIACVVRTWSAYWLRMDGSMTIGWKSNDSVLRLINNFSYRHWCIAEHCNGNRGLNNYVTMPCNNKTIVILLLYMIYYVIYSFDLQRFIMEDGSIF